MLAMFTAPIPSLRVRETAAGRWIPGASKDASAKNFGKLIFASQYHIKITHQSTTSGVGRCGCGWSFFSGRKPRRAGSITTKAGKTVRNGELEAGRTKTQEQKRKKRVRSTRGPPLSRSEYGGIRISGRQNRMARLENCTQHLQGIKRFSPRRRSYCSGTPPPYCPPPTVEVDILDHGHRCLVVNKEIRSSKPPRWPLQSEAGGNLDIFCRVYLILS